MGLFTKKNDDKQIISPVQDILGDHLIHLDGRGGNLFLHEKCLVFDYTKGGLYNLGNRTYKLIPIKSIIAIQIKSIGITTGYIEVSTYAHEYTKTVGFERTEDENTMSFGTEESAKAAREIMAYVIPRIL